MLRPVLLVIALLIPGGTGAGRTFDLVARSRHWAYQALASPKPDASIDSYLGARLKKSGLDPAPRASRSVLLRRLYFDLVGLPPTPEEQEQFLTDQAPGAWGRLVDRLLASPHFGERWARHWLDVIRYSETKGHVTDIERPFAWKYRDYVIDALNDDLPYDRFVTEHLAGDLIPPRPGRHGENNIAPTATGALFFHELHFMAVDPAKARWDEIDAQIDVVGKAFLGLTISCARCHDHKFDAISQRDYYALAGIFYSTELGKARVAPREPAEGERASEIANAEKAYQSFLDQKVRDRHQTQSKKTNDYFPVSEELGIQSPQDHAKVVQLMNRITKLDPSWAHWVRSAHDVKGTDVPFLNRGDHTAKEAKVPRQFLQVFLEKHTSPPNLESRSGRRYLAEQITNPSNPLTSRVWANRIWHHLFGRGIVTTPNDFGEQGRPPSHPELLDYLAHRLITSGWSTKEVIREIVCSQAYQRTSAEPSTRDPENALLSHRLRRRMDAEALRDSILATCGTLDRKPHGPSIQPFIPPYATANKPSLIPKSGPLDGDGRRSIYLRVRRNFSERFLQIFDFPNPGISTGARSVTTSPAQALAMMNSPFVKDQADRWGSKIAALPGRSQERVQAMFARALGRKPGAQELELLEALAEGVDPTSAQYFGDIAHVILNLAEFRYVD